MKTRIFNPCYLPLPRSGREVGWGVVLLCLLGLSGCDWIGRQADAVGEYMPTIGDRCENWQCMTTEGQRQSEMNKRAKAMKAGQMQPPAGQSAGQQPAQQTPSPAPTPAQGAPQPMEPSEYYR